MGGTNYIHLVFPHWLCFKETVIVWNNDLDCAVIFLLQGKSFRSNLPSGKYISTISLDCLLQRKERERESSLCEPAIECLKILLAAVEGKLFLVQSAGTLQHISQENVCSQVQHTSESSCFPFSCALWVAGHQAFKDVWDRHCSKDGRGGILYWSWFFPSKTRWMCRAHLCFPIACAVGGCIFIFLKHHMNNIHFEQKIHP